MFIGRNSELQVLQDRYDSGQFECVVIYGRRRVGKTSLITEFLRGKPHVMFPAMETSIDKNLETFSAAIGLALGMGEDEWPVFPSFASALARVFDMAQDQRTVLVIDEYPYLAAADPSASSALQHLIDHHQQDSKLMIILCGSSMSFMEHQVLGYQSPLYGRRTASLKIEPFDYAQSARFVPNMSAEEAAQAYAISNGIPQYLLQFDPDLDLETNLATRILTPGAYLMDETDRLLQQELRKPAEYSNVLQTIADGATRVNEIAEKSQLSPTLTLSYLNNLEDLGIVQRETPFGKPNSKRPVYRIRDSYFRFWYRFVPRTLPLIQSGNSQIATQMVMKGMPRFMGPVFETMCTQWLMNHNGPDSPLPFIITKTGRWWGTDPATHRQEEIDIIASGFTLEEGIPEGDTDPHTLYCECKWHNAPVGVAEYRTLVQRSQLVAAQQRHYMLFSKAGFTDELTQQAQLDPALTLVSYQDMIE